MTRKAKIWLSSALAFGGYLALAYSIPRWFTITGQRALILFGALAVIGLVAWLFTAILLSRRQPAPPPPQDPLSLEMDAAITQTERRLVEARVARGAVLHKLPAVFVLGPRQHHKTSCVIRSGVHAELLAGDVLRGVQVVPTQTINTWFAGQAIVAEVGVEVAQTPERFARFLARFQPARLSNALASGQQAPRAVLVCYSCEALREQSARDATPIAARELRATLSVIAQSYGIRLPVYVLFTKADALPGFKEFARRFTADEARDVLGATLPLRGDRRATEYAESASHEYRAELLALFESLATRRVDVLAREDAADLRGRAYQFPRELRKLEPLITTFLVELGRPSDLSTSPFVRGFYFSGVREVVVDAGAPAAAAITAAAHAGDDESATSLLGSLPRPGTGQAASPLLPQSSGRREAQWVFLDRLLSQVVLNDAAALGVTRGGTRISFFRRAALGTAAAAALLLVVAQLTAFAANTRLQGAVRRQTQAVVALPATPVAAPALAELAVLDSLGTSLDALSAYSWERRPVHLRWGMYQGDALYGTTHAAYFRQFRRLLLDDTFASMTARLSAMSGAPPAGAQFDSAYTRLRAYLVVTDSTTHADSATGDVLLANWPSVAQLDTAARALVARQFHRYARELPRRDPYPDQLVADQGVTAQARAVLRRSASDQLIYQAIVKAASDSIRGVNFNRDYAAGGALSAPHVVPGAFTRAGYSFVNEAIRNVNRYLDVESWVLGPDATGSAPDERALQLTLMARYDSQFVNEWRAVVRTAAVPRFASLRDASRILGLLAGGAQSPFMQLFALVNEHTSVDSADVGRFFDPVRQLGAARLAAPPPELIIPYLQQLGALSQQLQTTEQLPSQAKAQSFGEALNKVTDGAGALQAALGKLGPQQVDLQLAQLLSRPLDVVRDVVTREQRGAADASARGPVEDAGAALCQAFSALAQRRPISRDFNSPWASAADLAAVLSPTGVLADAMQNGLGDIFARRGSEFAPNSRAALQPEPSALAFLNRLAKIREALFPLGATEPQLQFLIAPVLVPTLNRAAITFGTQQHFEFDNRRTQKVPITWRLSSDRIISVEGARPPGRLVQEQSAWAPLFFFPQGRWENSGSGGWRFEFEYDPSLTIKFDVEMTPAVYDFLRQAAFEPALVCPNRWVR